MKRILLFSALFFGISLTLGTLIIKHPKTQKYLHDNLERVATDSWEGAVEIGALNASLLPPNIELTNVEISRKKNDSTPWFTLQRGVLKLSPWSIFKGLWVLDAIEVHGLNGTVDLHDPLFQAQPGPKEESQPFFSIESIVVSSSSLHLLHENGTLHIGDVEGQLIPQSESYHAQFQLTDSTLTYQGKEYEISGLAKGTLLGPLSAPKMIQLEGTELTLNGFQSRVVGSVEVTDAPNLNVGIELNGELEQINMLHPELKQVTGELSGTLRLEGPMLDPTINLDVALSSFMHLETPPYDIHLEGVYKSKHLDIRSLILQAPNKGSAQLTGQLDFTPPYKTNFDVTLNNASIGHILDAAGLPNAWVRAPLSGKIGGSGSISPLNLTTKVALSMPYFESLFDSYLNPNSAKMLQLAASNITANLQLGPNAAIVSQGHIQRGGTKVSLAGIFYFDAQQGMNLHFSSKRFKFSDIGSIAGMPFSGNGLIAGTLEGPYSDPTISSTVELNAFAIDNYFVGATKATLIYSDRILDFPRLAVTVGDGRMRGRGKLNFRSKILRCAGNLELDDVPVGPLLDSIILSTSDAKRFGGTVSGRAIIEGPIRNPKGSIRLKSPQLVLDKAQLGPATVYTRFGDKKEKLSIKLKINPNTGNIAAQYTLLNNSEMVLKTTLKSIPLPLLTPMLGDIALKGTFTGMADLKGPTNALNGKISLKATQFNAFGIDLETTQISGIASKGSLNLTGTMFDNDATFKGQLKLTRNLPYSATLRFEDLSLGRTNMLPKGPDYIGSGSIFSQGKLTKANSIMADATFQKLQVKIENTLLQQERPIRILFSNQSFNFQDFRFIGENVQFLINGIAPLRDPLNLRVYASGALAGINGLWAGLEFTRGKFDLNLRIQGFFGSPAYTGFLKLEEGTIVRKQMRLTNIDTLINFEEQTISIAKGQFKIGEGLSDFSGTILLRPKAPAEININASLQELQLRPIQDLTMTATGSLNLIGRYNDLELRGDISLQSLRYTANLDLQQFLKRQETPLTVPAFEPGNSWRLRVNIDADNNLFVSNNVLEAELKTNMRITGTTDHIGAIGIITPLWAKATYAGNTYKIERAILDFTEEYKIYSQFDVLATTNACGMKLKVSLNGNSERYVVEASGKDENGAVNAQDALLCAQFGVRLQNYAQADGSTLRNTLPGAVDALWKVSGMDERVRKLLPVVDKLRLTSGYSKSSARVEPRVLLAKELGTDWELKYNGPIYYDDEQHVISLEYRLNSNATLESTWVSVSEVSIGDLGLDLRLKWEFE